MDKKVRFHGHSPGSSDSGFSRHRDVQRVFLLSPVYLTGIRAQRFLGRGSVSTPPLRTGGVSLAELFCLTSPLYFRGKLAYAQRFARPPKEMEGCYVITSSRGLLLPETVLDEVAIREFSSGAPVDAEYDSYRIPLQRDAASLKRSLGNTGWAVLLGSVATEKYVGPLLEVFGNRLLFPQAFAGRGNLSRGALLLRCVREDTELAYVPVIGAIRTARRSPKLGP